MFSLPGRVVVARVFQFRAHNLELSVGHGGMQRLVEDATADRLVEAREAVGGGTEPRSAARARTDVERAVGRARQSDELVDRCGTATADARATRELTVITRRSPPARRA